jgi:HD domain
LAGRVIDWTKATPHDGALLIKVGTVDRLLEPHAADIGRDFAAYRNHVYRVVNLCVAISPVDGADLEKVAIAAAFHDLGIWTAGTLDYLRPSVLLAEGYLARSGKAQWSAEIGAMILEHHKVSRYRQGLSPLIEPFRRADWIDVSRGLIRFGLPRTVLRDIFAKWPSAGFHRRLVQLSLQHWRSHPFSPLPMLRL